VGQETDSREPDDYVRFSLLGEDLPAGARERPGGVTEQALAIAELTNEVAGAQASQPIRFTPAPSVQTDLSGGSGVHLYQHHDGIRVFGGEQTVGFAPGGTPDHTQARLVAAASPPEFRLEVTSDRAVVVAARHVSAPADSEEAADPDEPIPEPLDLTGFEPKVISLFESLPGLPTVFEPGPFAEPVNASLVWFPLKKRLRLAWDVTLTFPSGGSAYEVIVDAEDGSVLYSKQLVQYASPRGNVYALDPRRPRDHVDFPRPWSAYDLGVPQGLPEQPPAWVAADRSEGETAIAFFDETHLAIEGSSVDGVVSFEPADPLGQEQQVLNAFYGACQMHDVTYLLGFREADGSFQRGARAAGLADHRIKIGVAKGRVDGTAHWWRGKLSFGPKEETGRHSALDMTVVFHEYMHGVTSRLVGGHLTPAPFQDAQSGGMSEGWGDYVACTLTGATVFGAWTSNDELKGMRRFAYDEHFPVEQASFGILPTLKRYEIGELWCAFLLDVNRRIGRRLGLQLVVDGLKGLISNPSLLDGRNHILLMARRMQSAGRLSAREQDAVTSAIWAAAAGFGMGTGARSKGASLQGIVADTSVP
jgi:extracellular elastinolytic metalloproteinase